MSMGISNKCFNSLNKTIVDSGDYIKKKKQTTLYTNISNNIAKYGVPSPLKNNVRYDDSFGISSCSDNSGVLLYAKNYDLLLDITKGKYFSNPNFGSGAPASWEMWSGNTYIIDYSLNNINVLSGWDYSTITPGSIISNVTPITIPTIGGPGANPTSMITDNSWNCAPGYTVDPSNTLFYYKCAGINKGPAWVNYIDISFQHTHYYWKGVNSQPLQGMSYPSKISFSQQNPNPTDFLPVVPNDMSVKEVWCSGFNAIN